MRTYTVTRKKGSKLGDVFYSVGNFSFHFKKGSRTFKSVPELIAVRVAADYGDEFKVVLDSDTAEPDELLVESVADVGELTAGDLDDLTFKDEEN